MASNYPTSLDDTTSLPTRASGDAVAHTDNNDKNTAVIQLETKLGIGASTPTTGGYMKGTGTGTSAWGSIVAGDVPTLNQDTTGKSAKTDALDSATTVVNVAAATAPTTGQVLTATDSTHATWQTPAGGGGGGGMWSLVSAASLTGAGVTLSSLDGNTDILYKLIILASDNSSGFATSTGLVFNADTTNGDYETMVSKAAFGDSTTIIAESSSTHIDFSSIAVDFAYFEITIMAKTGTQRMLTFEATGANAGGDMRIYRGGGRWTDSTNNLTSIQIIEESGRNYQTGSFYRLYKRAS